ncbi:MAG: dihydropteroate synthase [Rhodospirillaceae bacterium]|nr:dihydropteroate synthase [Rhodospirillaceae bacterium]
MNQNVRYPAPGLGNAFSSSAKAYLAPADILSGPLARGIVESGRAAWFGGTEQAFCCVYLAVCTGEKVLAYRLSVREVEGMHPDIDLAMEGLQSPLPDFAGLSMDRPHIMGIVNVTPDSFSDGGERLIPEIAIADALAMVDAGATIIDVGGESTRPGASAVSPDEEIRRVEPVIRALAEQGICVSVDTRHAATMAAGVSAGARIVNDVTALTGDPEALNVMRAADVGVILMHMQGEPQTMQTAPVYACAPFDVFDYLRDRVKACVAAGIASHRLCVDPGIGFGKTVDHNLSILRWLSLYRGLGVPLLLGASRKTLITKVCGGVEPKARMPGSLALALSGVRSGANIVRVHDVAETVQAVKVQTAIDHAE